MAGEVNLTCTLGKPNVPVTNTPQLAYLLIEARPTGAVANVQMPVNFSLVLDHSGSMSGEKLHNMKEAVKLVLDQMQPQDYVALTIFDDNAKVVTASQPVANRAQLKSLVDQIRDQGGTEMSRGMQLGLAEVQKALAPTRVSRILLLTDGQTYGDEDRCKQLAADAGRLGVPITALGLGDDWNSQLLDAIAQASGGESDQVDAPTKVQQVFQKALQSMKGTVINNALLILRLVGGITPRQVWRVIPLIAQLSPKSLSDRDVQVPLGDLEKDTGQAVLAELMLPVRPAGRYRIAQAEVSYDVPAARIVGEKVRSDVLLAFTDDALLAQQYDPRVMNLVEKVTAFKLQTRALDEAQAGNLAGATQKLRAAATRLLEMGETDLAAAAQAEAQRLEQGQGLSAAGAKKLQYQTRKLTQKLDS
ncbi:MAG: VWA domain-containing protein [Planctomycetes bacterium]|nr:VWA domain-containing protein [Planctomycetota bacterium]